MISRLFDFLGRHRGFALAVGYVVLGFVVVIVLVVATGGNVGVALVGWFQGSFGSGFSLVQTISDATPLALVALGVAVALRAGVITVGAEGQLVLGAIFATVVAFWVGDAVPLWLGLTLGALAGILGGALWALFPALAKIRWGVNEVLFTLLANYLADYLLNFLLRTSLRDRATQASPQSAELPASSQLPQLPLPGQLHIGVILVVLILIVATWWRLTRSAFLIDVFGQRPVLAARLGLTPTRAVIATMLVSGAAAGLAGWMQVAGVTQRLEPDVSGGIGFAGLAVAVLGRGNPIGIAVASVLYASLGTGASGVQIATGTTPASIGTVSQGVLLLCAALALGATQFNRRRAAIRNRPVEPVTLVEPAVGAE